jgi:hypothetical protein
VEAIAARCRTNYPATSGESAGGTTMPYGNTSKRFPATRWLSALACSKVSLATETIARACRRTPMAVTRYQFRLSTYLLTVVIAALVAASPRLISRAVRGRPPEYVSVQIDGKPELFDARVWPTHPLNPKNRAALSGIAFPPKL